MQFLSLGFVLLLTLGCASKSHILQSDFEAIRQTNTGALITVNLDTNGKVREDKSCYLNIQDGESRYELPLIKGSNDYALPLASPRAEIVKISCGPFYYYELQNQGADFMVSNQNIKYLGVINFKFEDKGKLEWGHATTNSRELKDKIRSMGFEDERVEVELLKL